MHSNNKVSSEILQGAGCVHTYTATARLVQKYCKEQGVFTCRATARLVQKYCEEQGVFTCRATTRLVHSCLLDETEQIGSSDSDPALYF
jgi:hypothetical protein